MGIKIISHNKRARYDYFLEETIEAGLVLHGTEVKSLRAGKVSLGEAFVTIDRSFEVWVNNMTIPHYEFGNLNNHDETRKRKLLLNRVEIDKLQHRMKAEGLIIIPTKIYFKRNRVKLEMALAKGKKLHDKRHDKAKKDVERKLRQGKYD